MLFKALNLSDPSDLDNYLGRTVILLFGQASTTNRFTFQDLQRMGQRDLSRYGVDGTVARQVALPRSRTPDLSYGKEQNCTDWRIYLSEKAGDALEHRVKNMKGAINKWFYGKTGTEVKLIVRA